MADRSLNQQAEKWIPQFQFERLLNQDQAGRRISLLGTIESKPAILLAERAAFTTDTPHLQSFPSSLTGITNLGANDIYSWFLANLSHGSPDSPPKDGAAGAQEQPPDLKLNLIYPSTAQHIKKYAAQQARMVTETAAVYARHVRPYMESKRAQGRLNWVFNILDGLKEQEDVLYAEPGAEAGFVVLPDLNWDRKTVGGLHLLALVQRRDIWSLRDLRREHVGWLKHMRRKLVETTASLYPGVEEDMLKLYVHYQPTYYHFHIHIVNVALEAGATQSVGKAFGLENIISQLEAMPEGKGMADVSLTYYLGEASELWTEIFSPLKEGRLVAE